MPPNITHPRNLTTDSNLLNKKEKSFFFNKENRLNRFETINKKLLGYILNETDQQCTELMERATNHTKTNRPEFEPVRNHCDKIFKSLKDNTLKTKFFQPSGNEGRINAVSNMSMQVLSRPIRHALCVNTYIDIDIVNCHPTILEQYCIKNNISCEALGEYNINRTHIFENILKKNPSLESGHLKKAILSLLNGGNKDYNDIPQKTIFIKNFAKEIKKIIKEVADINPDLVKTITKKRKLKKINYNNMGASMCIILQRIENEMLMVMEETFVIEGVSLEEIIPIHDGLMFPSKYKIDTHAIMHTCEKNILAHMGYTVSIIEKEMDAHGDFTAPEDTNDLPEYRCPLETLYESTSKYKIDMGDDFVSMSLSNKLDTHTYPNIDDATLDVMCMVNRCYGLVNTSNHYIIKTHVGKFIMERFLTNMSDVSYMDDKNELATINMLDIIKNNKAVINKYSGTCFEPEKHKVGHDFNLWPGFRAKYNPNYSLDDIAPILYHIKHVWCNGDEQIYDWVIGCYFHKLFTEPGRKYGTALNLTGSQGAGKGGLINNFIIPLVFGNTISRKINGMRAITDNFNGCLDNRIFVLIEELSDISKGTSNMDLLKTIVSEDSLEINKKGIEKKYKSNYTKFIFISNHKNSLYMEAGDRRYLPLNISDIHLNDSEYNSKLPSLYTDDRADGFFSHCCDYKTDQNPWEAPMTEYKKNLILNQSSSSVRFITELKEISTRLPKSINEIFGRLTITIVKNENLFSCNSIYDEYGNWCAYNNERISSEKNFTNAIEKFVIKKRISSSWCYHFGRKITEEI